jgi:hypothetical protein
MGKQKMTTSGLIACFIPVVLLAYALKTLLQRLLLQNKLQQRILYSPSGKHWVYC